MDLLLSTSIIGSVSMGLSKGVNSVPLDTDSDCFIDESMYFCAVRFYFVIWTFHPHLSEI